MRYELNISKFEFMGIKNLMNVITRDIKMYGFIMTSLQAKYEKAFNDETSCTD